LVVAFVVVAFVGAVCVDECLNFALAGLASVAVGGESSAVEAWALDGHGGVGGVGEVVGVGWV
jgi:hypothetical protein